MVTVCMEMLEYDEDYDMELVGDFTTLTLLEVCQQKGGNFADRAKAIQQRLTEDLEHSTYSAVGKNISYLFFMLMDIMFML